MVGKNRWGRWRWRETPRGPGTYPRSQKRSKEVGVSTDGDGGLFLPGSGAPWCNSNYRWRNDLEILRKPGRRKLRKREEEEVEEEAAGQR